MAAVGRAQEPSLASASRCRSSSPGRRFPGRRRLLGRQDRRVRRVDSLRRVVGTALALEELSRQELIEEGAAERRHASIIARRRLGGIVNGRSFDDSTYRYDGSVADGENDPPVPQYGR